MGAKEVVVGNPKGYVAVTTQAAASVSHGTIVSSFETDQVTFVRESICPHAAGYPGISAPLVWCR